nr:methionine adenosyltransferase [Candidatus Woesearchaeota archaeon]
MIKKIRRYKTAESVTEGHPDKVCDIISDALVDLYISVDHEALVSIKALAARDLVCLGGEVGGYKCLKLDIEETIRKAIKDIGYDQDNLGFNSNTLSIIDKIDRHEINDFNKLSWGKNDLLGSRDQCIVFGYACNETEEFMPLPITLAHKLAKGLTELRKNKILDYLGPDGKTQVTIEYEKGIPKRIENVVISTLHSIDIQSQVLEDDLKEKLIIPTLGDFLDKNTNFYINPTGRFIVGGPAIDTGLTGRKLIVDSYGDASKHGGGAFSGKDPTSSDRCGAYLARYIAKNIVASCLAKECEVELSYAIGSFVPLNLTINTYGTGKLEDRFVEEIVEESFDLTISGSMKNLSLRKPIYKRTASYGHFGKEEFPWEATDKVDLLKSKIGGGASV